MLVLPRILLVGTGGTITMTPGAAGMVPTLSGEDLVRAVPELARHARLEVVSFSAKPGASLTLEDLIGIADLVDRRLCDGCAGAEQRRAAEHTSAPLRRSEGAGRARQRDKLRRRCCLSGEPSP